MQGRAEGGHLLFERIKIAFIEVKEHGIARAMDGVCPIAFAEKITRAQNRGVAICRCDFHTATTNEVKSRVGIDDRLSLCYLFALQPREQRPHRLGRDLSLQKSREISIRDLRDVILEVGF